MPLFGIVYMLQCEYFQLCIKPTSSYPVCNLDLDKSAMCKYINLEDLEVKGNLTGMSFSVRCSVLF